MREWRQSISRAASWVLALVAVVVFYLLSVPVVYAMHFRGAHRTLQLSPWTPQWIQRYMEPYFWLARNTSLEKPLYHYFIWCQQRAKDIAVEVFE